MTRFRIEYRDRDWNIGVGHVEADSQLLAEVKFLREAKAEGRKLWCTWSCREPVVEPETR